MAFTGRPFVPLEIRFWRFVSKRPDGCWPWIGAKDKDGYGFIKRQDGTQLRAHRVSYEMHKGPITKPYVCHTCDNPPCVNPEHLFLGTNKDNQQDSIRKGRHVSLPGESNPMARLTGKKARRIFRDTRYQYVIAADYGITQGHVSDIKLRKRWAQATRFIAGP